MRPSDRRRNESAFSSRAGISGVSLSERVDLGIHLLAKANEVQLVNYLVATGIDEGLLLNFGAERLEYKKKFRLPKQEQVSL